MHITICTSSSLTPRASIHVLGGLSCTVDLFNPGDLTEHLRTKHSIHLAASGASKKSYAPLNGDLSRLLSDYRGNSTKEETGDVSEFKDETMIRPSRCESSEVN